MYLGVKYFMKKILIIIFVLIFTFSSFAQTPTNLPANIAKWSNQDSLKLLSNAAIKSRLKKLLDKKNYADFRESWETVNPIVKKGNFLFSSGCLIHACGHVESAIAIDLVNQTVHVGIYRDEDKPKFFNERGRKTPNSIKNWANRLLANKK